MVATSCSLLGLLSLLTQLVKRSHILIFETGNEPLWPLYANFIRQNPQDPVKLDLGATWTNSEGFQFLNTHGCTFSLLSFWTNACYTATYAHFTTITHVLYLRIFRLGRKL